MAQVKPIPDGLHSITPQLTIDGCAKAIDWYKKALGAEETARAPDPSGQKIWHAAMRIGNSTFFLNDAFPDMGGHAHMSSLWLYMDDVDKAFARAIDAGAKSMMPPADMFWGDRTGTLMDPFGNRWTIAKHIKDMTPEEMKKAQEAFIASMPKK